MSSLSSFRGTVEWEGVLGARLWSERALHVLQDGELVMAFSPSSSGAAPTARAWALTGATAAPANASGTVTMSRSTFDAGSDRV